MLSRRTFVTSALAAPFVQAKTTQPNVLFIAVDDMNDWVGCLRGYPGVQTPNIDRLARRGVLFSNAHCASPLCNPSRTSLLTGLRPSTSGVYNNEQFWRPALPQAISLPQYFKQNGYHVAGAGKVFHHTSGNNPPDQWDEFQLQVFDDPWYRRADWYPWNQRIPVPSGYPYNGIRNFPGEFDWGVLPKEESAYGDQRAVEFGTKILSRKYGKPFFLAVGLWHPHIPMYSPQKYWDLYPPDKVQIPVSPEDDLNDVPKVGQQLAAFRREEFTRIVREDKWKEFVRAYLAAISFADAMIGDLVNALDRSAHAKNTIVVFWSDNGWHLGEKQHVHKSTLWQRSTHVPLVIAGPGAKATGRTRPQPVSLLDLYPTLVDLCGLPPRPQLEGVSLTSLLRDPNAKHDPVVSTFEPGNHAVCDTRWRYIHYHDGGEELYDRTADPNEWHNLAGDPTLDAIKRQLARFLPEKSAPPVPDRTAYDFDFTTYSYRRKP